MHQLTRFLRRFFVRCSHRTTYRERVDGVLCERCADCLAYRPVGLEIVERRAGLEQRLAKAKDDWRAWKASRPMQTTVLRLVK